MHAERLADRARAYALRIVPKETNENADATNRFFEDVARTMIGGLAAFHKMEAQCIRRGLAMPYGDFQRFCASVGGRTAGYDAASADVIRSLVAVGKMDVGAFMLAQNTAWHRFVSAESAQK